jgi:hypothetical protein
MDEHFVVTGILSDQKTVILDEPIALPTGRVRITVERLADDSFWNGPSIAELAKAQGVQPIQSLDELWGDFWPDDESVDEFICNLSGRSAMQNVLCSGLSACVLVS